ncbi:hypothetical protein CASFOL_040919 [Castilleja foliolosa]|uniref:Gnk2-homologous domain-containing protein n=1 Tax=Castilleja foliolosa TaxID=1961234 RepID=A0ABD3BDH4_9LAMI
MACLILSSIIRAFPIFPILISYSLLIPTTISQNSPLLNHVCTNTSQNYTKDTTYAINLKNLIDDLFVKTPQNYLFAKESYGEGPNKVYGLAQCRSDISPDDCDYCLYDARCKITQRCYKRSAIVWYDNCQLKYSNVDFFGKIDNEDDFVMINVKNVSNSQREKFRETSIGLLTDLSKQASDKANKYMFAGGDKLFDEKKNVTIHGMALCTRDLTYDDCKKCLGNIVKELPIYNKTIYSVGARVVGASCTVRYETYVFVNSRANV